MLLPIETVPTDRAGAQPRDSIYHLHGAIVLLPAAAPLLAAVLVAVLLRARTARGWALGAAWALSGAVALAAIVGTVTFLIGVFVLPTGVLLLVATSQSHTARP